MTMYDIAGVKMWRCAGVKAKHARIWIMCIVWLVE